MPTRAWLNNNRLMLLKEEEKASHENTLVAALVDCCFPFRSHV